MAERFETQYSDEQIAEAISLMPLGITLKEACAEVGIGYSAAKMRIHRENEKFGDLYARARAAYADTRVAEMDEIAATEPDVQRARLMCDNIKWAAAKVLPKKYGDKLQHTGDGGGPISVSVYIPDNGRDKG